MNKELKDFFSEVRILDKLKIVKTNDIANYVLLWLATNIILQTIAVYSL